MDELVKLRTHGISAGFVRRLADAGYKQLSVDELVRIKIHGMSDVMIRNNLDKSV